MIETSVFSNVSCYVSDVNCDGVTDHMDRTLLRAALSTLGVLPSSAGVRSLAQPLLASIQVTTDTLVYDVNCNGILTTADYTLEVAAILSSTTTIETMLVVGTPCNLSVFLEIRSQEQLTVDVLLQPALHPARVLVGTSVFYQPPLKKSIVRAVEIASNTSNKEGRHTSFFWVTVVPSSSRVNLWLAVATVGTNPLLFDEGPTGAALFQDDFAHYQLPTIGSNTAPLLTTVSVPASLGCVGDADFEMDWWLPIGFSILMVFVLLVGIIMHRRYQQPSS